MKIVKKQKKLRSWEHGDMENIEEHVTLISGEAIGLVSEACRFLSNKSVYRRIS